MLSVRGVCFDVDEVPDDVVRRDLAVIQDELGCTAVQLVGVDERALTQAAEAALTRGLSVWIRPYAENTRPDEMIAYLDRMAIAAEALHQLHPGRVTLLVGVELSRTSRGIVPGGSTFVRLMLILRAKRLLRSRIRRRLDRLLDRAVRTARARYSGPLSYAAAMWEDVDWSRFDLVGLNLYRIGGDHEAYRRQISELVEQHERPVVITEFGCGAFDGADQRGPGAFLIVNWFKDPPVIRREHPRDEDVQAGYLTELIDVYAKHGVSGCFVFTYAMSDFPRHEEPPRDLDRAGFGLVAVTADEPHVRVPKKAFAAVARSYAAAADARAPDSGGLT